MEILMALMIGMAAGISSGLFGIGGGVIIVPLVAMLYNFQQQAATATSLISLLIPAGAFIGVLQYYQKGFISAANFKIGFLISLGLFFGSFIGVRIAVQLSSSTLTKIFSLFLIVIAIRLWWSSSQ